MGRTESLTSSGLTTSPCLQSSGCEPWAGLRDVQAERALKPIPLKKVGIRGLKWPIAVMDKYRGVQHTVAEVSLYVELAPEKRAVHMSRFIEALKGLRRLTPRSMRRMLNQLRNRLEAERAYIELKFTYFIWKRAPVTCREAPVAITAHLIADTADKPGQLRIGVEVPVTLLCPCSKEISDRGAHNQRAVVKLMILTGTLIWFEELAELIDSCASSPVYTLLKRPDERFVTHLAYDNPKFVEDIVRDISDILGKDTRVKWYRVEVESAESIHAHQVYACLEVSSDDTNI